MFLFPIIRAIVSLALDCQSLSSFRPRFILKEGEEALMKPLLPACKYIDILTTPFR